MQKKNDYHRFSLKNVTLNSSLNKVFLIPLSFLNQDDKKIDVAFITWPKKTVDIPSFSHKSHWLMVICFSSPDNNRFSEQLSNSDKIAFK